MGNRKSGFVAKTQFPSCLIKGPIGYITPDKHDRFHKSALLLIVSSFSAPYKHMIYHCPLNATISSISVLQFTAERTESLVDGEGIFINRALQSFHGRSLQISLTVP